MKQRLILFSALLIMSLSLGVASAQEDLGVNVTCNETDVIPGDVVNITADFNRAISQATISVNNSNSVLMDNVSMEPQGSNDIGGNSFSYDYEIPLNIISDPLDLNISAFNSSIEGSKIVDNAFVFNVSGDYLDIGVELNRTGNFRPGDVVNITANFSKPVDHANISIASTDLPAASLVGADLVTDVPMEEIDDDTFAYDYPIPDGITNGPLDIDISGFDDLGNLIGDESFLDGLNVGDPYITIINPSSEFVGDKCVDFNFTAYDYTGYDQSGSQITYTFYLDGIAKNNGVINSGTYKVLEFELAEGYHTWEVKTRDSYGSVHTSGTRALYVDTNCPSVKLISPLDCSKEVIGAIQFNFTCEDALATQYKDNLSLSYQLYIDGEPADNLSGNYGNGSLGNELFGNELFGNEFSGDAKSGESIIKELDLDDGAHNWSVSVQDGAGNNGTSEVRKFYVSLDGLSVSLDTPNGGYVPANPKFIFKVAGKNGEGVGLPFHYKLIINGKEVDSACEEKKSNTVCCTDEECCEDGLLVGEDNYSVTTSVADGQSISWTVNVTDCASGKSYQPAVQYFSVDSKAPACVANLNVLDIPGETYWTDLSNSPGLYASWNASTEKDLTSKPYEVFISTSKPSCIEDMEQVTSTSNTSLLIVNCSGKSLVYGKDYWVAVIARDNASNYDKSFAMCGPVQTYEDMDIALDEGWNLKSVPKRLVASYNCPETVFGDGSTVLYWDGSCWQFPDTIEPCKGYWVYTKEPCVNNVKLKGMSSDGANPDVPASLTLTPGWHMIGHTSAYAAPWSMTLSSLSDFELLADYRFSNLITYSNGEGWGGIIPSISDILTNEGGSMVGQSVNDTDPVPVEALQTYGYMVPGQGYWIFMKDEGTYASIENTYNLDLMMQQ